MSQFYIYSSDPHSHMRIQKSVPTDHHFRAMLAENVSLRYGLFHNFSNSRDLHLLLLHQWGHSLGRMRQFQDYQRQAARAPSVLECLRRLFFCTHILQVDVRGHSLKYRSLCWHNFGSGQRVVERLLHVVKLI